MRMMDAIASEWRMQFQRPSALLLLLAFAAVLVYGGLAGKAERDGRAAAIASHHADIAGAMDEWLADLRELERLGAGANLPPRTGSPMDVVFASSLPQAPLADFAVGQSDLLPFLGEISLWDPDIRLFSKYEIADPVALALGGFDISKAVILFLPLLLLVFCFDAIAADRDANRLGLAVAQGVSVRRLFWRRLLPRAGIVLFVAFAAAAVALLMGQGGASPGGRLAAFGLWSLLALVYGLFWLMLIAWVASFNRSGEFNVLVLLGLWVGLTLVVPAATSAAAEALYPTPSRLAYLADAREVENQTRLRQADVANQFMLDHPELLVNQESQIPAFVQSAFLVTSTVDEATQPVLASFEAALRGRENVIGLFRYLSPAVAVHSLFNELAGTSAGRHQDYLAQARQFKAEYARRVGPNVVAMQPIDSAFYLALPEFRFDGEPLADRLARGAAPLAVLLLLSALMAALANRRLGAASPIDS